MKKTKETGKNTNLLSTSLKKQGRPIKEVVPANNSKYLRENMPVNSNFLLKEINVRTYAPFAEPFPIPSEFFQSVEEINKDLLTLNYIYEDPFHEEFTENLPFSFMKALITLGAEIKWIRIEDCVRNYLIDREIKISYPKKNYVKMRNDIREKYESNKKMKEEGDFGINTEDDVETLLADDEESRKKNIYKEFYKLLDRKLDIRVVNFNEREESDEDFKKRKEEEFQEKQRLELLQKSQKKGGKNLDTSNKKPNTKTMNISINGNTNIQQTNVPLEGDRLKFKECAPGSISIIEKIRNPKSNYTSLIDIPAFFMLNSYCKWISSVLQLIKDLDINDAYTNRPIWYNIYPQKDGIPIYNPQGKYVIKLYFMGKPRMIEIDDRIPCNRYEDYLFPKTDYIEEIWPALFTKALMKLNAYKMKHPKYYLNEEIGDCSVIYALTGYIGENINISNFPNNSQENLSLVQLIENILSDEFYLDKKKYLICLNRRESNLNQLNNQSINNTANNLKISSDSKNNIHDLLPAYESIKEDFYMKKNITTGFNLNFDLDSNALVNRNSVVTNFEKQIRSAERKLTKRNTIVLKNDMISNLAKALSLNGIGNKEANPESESEVIKISGAARKFSTMLANVTNRAPSVSTGKLIKMNSIRRASIKGGSDNLGDDIANFKHLLGTPGSPGDYEDEQASLPLTNNSNIYYDFAYSITDFFDNNNFNMNRLKPLDFSDLKQKIKEAHSTAYKQLSKEEKKNYLANLKELKNKQKEERQRRMDELKKEGKKFNLVKIKNQVSGASALNFYIDYSEEEIFMAKKCLLNKWNFPPPNYFENFFNKELKDGGLFSSNQTDYKKINDSPRTKKISNPPEYKQYPSQLNLSKDSVGLNEDISMELAKNKRNLQTNNWNKDIYMQLINENISQYFIMRDPVMRQADGVWMNYTEFKKLFNRVIVLHNPNKVYLGGKLSADNNWNYWNTDFYEPNDETNVFYLSVNNGMSRVNTYSNVDQNLSQSFSMKDKTSLLILFKPNSDKTLPSSNKINYYINLDLVDGSGEIIKENIILTSFFATFYYPDLDSNKDYFLIIKGGVFPFGYYFQVLSEIHFIENLSHNNYLKRFNCFNYSVNKIDHPSIEKNKFFLLSRCVLRCSGDKKYVNVKVTLKYPDRYAKRFIEIYVYQNKKGEKKRMNLNEMIKLDCYGYDENEKYVINNYYVRKLKIK